MAFTLWIFISILLLPWGSFLTLVYYVDNFIFSPTATICFCCFGKSHFRHPFHMTYGSQNKTNHRDSGQLLAFSLYFSHIVSMIWFSLSYRVHFLFVACLPQKCQNWISNKSSAAFKSAQQPNKTLSRSNKANKPREKIRITRKMFNSKVEMICE